MLKNLFPRLFGQFREGGIIHAKFVTSGTAGAVTFALKSAVGTQNYQSLTLVRSGAGVYTLTLAGAARAIAVLNITVGAPAARAGLRLEPSAAAYISESAGTVSLRSVTASGTVTTDVIDAADEVHVTLYVDR
jgi:hypothetical protein